MTQVIDGASRQLGRSGTWLAVVEELLIGCRKRSADYHAEVARHHQEAEALGCTLRAEAAALLRAAPSAQVTVESAELLSRLVATRQEEWTGSSVVWEVEAARALALAIDDERHESFLEQFRDRGITVLRPGEVHPVLHHDPRDLLSGRPTTRPEVLRSSDLGYTPHLRVADAEAADFEYVLDWDAYGRLAPLRNVQRMRITTAQPNLALSDFDRAYPDDPARFANHGVHDPHGQAAVLRRSGGRWPC